MRSPKLWVLALAVMLASSVAASAADTAKTGTTDSSETKYHDGGINDLSAIGNRNVGCGKGMGNWYSIEKQIALGKRFADQIDHTAKMVQDPVVTEYVNRVGQNIVRNSDARVPFTIKVIDSDEVNAFALPGGFFFVNSGLILAADNESELAGVMAHEIAHVCACHAARGATRGEIASLATIPLIFVGGGLGYAVSGIAGLSLPVAFVKFSREFEAQADYLGVEYLYKSGYDPESFVQFFEKIEAMEKKKPGLLDKTFENHPPTPDRIEKTQEEIGHILPDRNQYLLDTSEFQTVKSRLALLQNRHKVDDKKEATPSLRHGEPSGNTNNSDQNQKKDDDQPTLHRRES
ncbi:MAG: M48 family metallopeptidase [Candidatus Korobacteraceae bacterium]